MALPPHHLIRVPTDFHSMVGRLEVANRDLARLEAGLPATESGPRGPTTVEEAYRILCYERKWLYEWVEANVGTSRKAGASALLRFL